jgi:bla regulator protein BlaR1
MILYIIKSILCSTLFITAYYLLLEKEKMHRFKRWYLLGYLPPFPSYSFTNH